MKLNLCEILKGHEGETFYSPMYGEVKLIGTDSFIFPGNSNYPIVISGINGQDISNLCPNGHFLNEDRGECMLFPSKDQRDWNKWVEEQKPKTPKTWSKIKDKNIYYFKVCNDLIELESSATVLSPIEKSALALLKIHQLIEVGYGGNVTNEEWRNSKLIKVIISRQELKEIGEDTPFTKLLTQFTFSHIAFHTKEQAEEFLKYPENVQLLKDYFMI